jgi:dihydrodiol dehydrogenase / D-xylose 1-dehydrogenase (NADP)
MYASAERNNVMLQDGIWTRFFPAVEHARSLLEAGAIGEVVMVQSDFESLYTTQAAILAYGKDAKPIRIQAGGMKIGPGGAILEYENNRFAILTFIRYPSEFPEVTEITGTKGRITLEQPGHCPTRLSVRIPVATPSRYRGGNTPSPLQQFEYPLPDSISLPGAHPNQQGFYYMTEAIHRCLAAGLRECPQFVQAESLLLLELLETIRSLRADNSDDDA